MFGSLGLGLCAKFSGWGREVGVIPRRWSSVIKGSRMEKAGWQGGGMEGWEGGGGEAGAVCGAALPRRLVSNAIQM